MDNIFNIALFVIAAIVGIYLFSLVLGDKKRPILIVAIHGLVAIAAYGVLTFNVSSQVREGELVTQSYPLESYAFVCFSFAALGGLYMFFRDKYLKIGIKKWMPLIHGILAATGLIILIVATVLNK